MKVKIEPSQLKGGIKAPPSKSFAHRMLICAALARGSSTVHGISGSDDMKATMACMRALGAQAEQTGDTVTVEGITGNCSGTVQLECNESGSTLRFFIPLSLVFAEEAVFKGTKRLIERGAGIYEEMLGGSGISFEKGNESIAVRGKLKAGHYTMRGNVSSQFASGMLFALPLLEGDSSLTVTEPVESRSYIDITLSALSSFGIETEESPKNTFHIKGSQEYKAGRAFVEGDWSNAAFLYGFNSIGAQIDISGLNNESIQGDMACVSMFKALDGEAPRIDLSNCPDLGPVLFAAAAAKNGAAFTGIRRLRIKESDRAAVMAAELAKFGIECDVKENEMTVRGGNLKKPCEVLNGYNDHRIVMSLAMLLSLTGGEIEDAQAVRKSWPDFFEEMKKLGMRVSCTDGGNF